ncbi:MAG: FliO/MopB family protein [Waddliaceae bacterium]
MRKLFQAALLYLCFTSCMGLQLYASEVPKTTVTTQNVEKEALPPEFAKELKQAEEDGDSRFFQEFLNMLFYLGIIVLFVLVLMWVLKRLTNVRMAQINQTSSIKILESRPLTPKTTIYVLGIFGKTVAIADSVNGVTLLSEMNIKQEVPPITGKTLKEQE